MTAIIQCDGYATKILSARVLIEKATYDLSNAQLYNETVVYNQDDHNLVVKGKPIENEKGMIIHNPATLPQGVRVDYSITKIKDGKGNNIATDKQQTREGYKAVDAGTYKVCAQFKGDASNYNVIPDSIAYLTIERAEYDLSKVEFIDKTATYSGETYALSISETSKLPYDVEVSYQIKQLKDGLGNAVVDSYKKGNSAVNAGTYLVQVRFSVTGKNAENYTTNPLEKEAYLTILPATYNEAMKGVYVHSEWYELKTDGVYEISLTTTLPEGVTPQFALTNEQGEVIEGEVKIEKIKVAGSETSFKIVYKYTFTVDTAGVYACVVTFAHTNQNYQAIALALEAWVFITDNT
jgi:hypothetical protein